MLSRQAATGRAAHATKAANGHPGALIDAARRPKCISRSIPPRARRRTLAPITSGVLVAAALLVAPVSHAATTGSCNVARQARTAGGFQAISLRSSVDLVVRQGSRASVLVRADDNILPLVQTFV